MYICKENNRLKVIHPHPKGWGFLTLGHINFKIKDVENKLKILKNGRKKHRRI